jgi:hypothetical protein
MQKSRAIIAGALAAVFVTASASSADAYWRGHRGYYGHYYGGYYGGPGPVLGLVGGVVVGAATIATAPFAILGAALGARPAPDYGPPPGYYPPPPPPDYYGYRQNYYGYRQAPGYYDRY